ELKKQNEELEKVADALENDKDLDEEVDLKKRKKEIEYSIDQLEKDIEDRKKQFIKNGASEEEATKLAQKEFNESDGGKNKLALDTLYNQLNKINEELGINEEENEKEEEIKPEISTIETVIPTTGITIDIQSQNKLDTPFEQLEKQDFNGRLH